MSTINRTMYPLQSSMSLITKMSSQFSKLQEQLSTGERATNLAELGSDRYFDLSIRAKIGKLDGYKSSVDMVNLRLSMFDQVTSRLDTVESNARASITPSAYGTDKINFGSVPSQAKASLDEVVNLLNSDVNGRYIFGGAKTDVRPVTDMTDIIDGVSGKAGFKQVAAERLQADVGDGMGRLTSAVATDTVSLTEDGAHPFGMKLSTLTESGSGITVTSPGATPPKSLSVQFTGVPAAGSSVTLGLTMPDGTEEGITLKAVTGTPGAGEFQIGVDADTTAANFKAALDSSLTGLGSTKLVAASNNAAAENFFNAQGQPVLRVQGPSFATATALQTADPTTTVLWYKGGDATDARASVTARIDDTATVNYGAQANESGPVNLVRGLAVLAIQDFPTSDATSEARYDAIASRNLSRLSEAHNSENGSIEMLGVQLSSVTATMGNITDRQTSYKAQLQGMLSDLETVPDSETAMQLLALQTRLQASYQAISLISQLSLVNYIK